MAEFGVTIQAYCLMTNHVHWVVVPSNTQALARAFGWLHGRYAQYQNAAQARHGHFWQNRFFSCPLDDNHTWAAVRYVERNPVRASLVSQAEDWLWSSAAARLGLARSPLPLDLAAWGNRFSLDQWRIVLTSSDANEAEQKLRSNTYSGRPTGDESFVAGAEAILNRQLIPQKGGRPRKVEAITSGQLSLFAN
jgi:putative transposase